MAQKIVAPAQTYTGHGDRVWSLDVVAGVLVTGGGDCSLKLWDVVSGQCTRTINVLDGNAIVGVQLVGGGIYYAAAKQVYTYMINNETTVPASVPTSLQPLALCMEVCAPLLYIGYADHVIRVWKNGICKGRYQGHMGEVRCLKVVGHAMYSGSEDQTVIRWNTNTAKPTTLFKGTNGPIRDVIVHYDDMYLTNGKAVRVQRVSSGELRFNLHGHRDVVVTLALDAAAGVLYSGGADQRVGVWNARDGTALAFFAPPQPDIVKAIRLEAGYLFAAIGSLVHAWNTAPLLQSFGAAAPPQQRTGQVATSPPLSPRRIGQPADDWSSLTEAFPAPPIDNVPAHTGYPEGTASPNIDRRAPNFNPQQPWGQPQFNAQQQQQQQFNAPPPQQQFNQPPPQQQFNQPPPQQQWAPQQQQQQQWQQPQQQQQQFTPPPQQFPPPSFGRPLPAGDPNAAASRPLPPPF